MPAEEIEISLRANTQQFFDDLNAQFDKIAEKFGKQLSQATGTVGAGAGGSPGAAGLLASASQAALRGGEIAANQGAAYLSGGPTAGTSVVSGALREAISSVPVPGAGAVAGLVGAWIDYANKPVSDAIGEISGDYLALARGGAKFNKDQFLKEIDVLRPVFQNVQNTSDAIKAIGLEYGLGNNPARPTLGFGSDLRSGEQSGPFDNSEEQRRRFGVAPSGTPSGQSDHNGGGH